MGIGKFWFRAKRALSPDITAAPKSHTPLPTPQSGSDLALVGVPNHRQLRHKRKLCLFIAQHFLAKLIISLAKVYRYWYTFVMSYYETIYEYAADNYGLITSGKARDLGVSNMKLVKLSHRGRLIRIGHGVYRIVHYIPTLLDKYAEAVAIVGEDAHIFGESVLAIHGLEFVNPAAIFVATKKEQGKICPDT